jgi:ribosomal peptide maturation radical SAM protein 1
MKVILCSLPFGAPDRPALGISLLKANLTRRGIACDVAYLFSEFAEMVGLDTYQWLTDEVPYTSFAGDWCFTLPLYGRRSGEDEEYVKHILKRTWAMSGADIRRIVETRELTPAFIDRCLDRVDWEQYNVIGFTSTFVQNMASLALAQRLKKRLPKAKIVFGGANWEGEMGEALHASFPFVDFVCQGEADESFPRLIEALAANKPISENAAGILYRDTNGASISGGKAVPITDVDALPIPDFRDYFTMLRSRPIFRSVVPMLLMETSRGCWWGEKHHCTFCGLNGNGLAFRSKSSARALSELTELTTGWNIGFVSMVDNILDMAYFRSLLPELANRRSPTRLFYETKANLTRSQIKLLAEAGVMNIQPGVESLSDHVLKLMRKGTTGLRNIQLLKYCREYDINVDWNLLYGFPGETGSDYRAMLKRMPTIRHLQPPSGSGPIRLDRFSPYFETPEAFGLKNVRPMEVFHYLYPFDRDVLHRIACYFDFDYGEHVTASDDVANVIAFIGEWNADPSPGHLMISDTGKGLNISDTRTGWQRAMYQLSDYERVVYLLCDEITTVGKIVSMLNHLFPGETFNQADLLEFLGSLEANGLISSDGERYLSLGVYDSFPWHWQEQLSKDLPMRPNATNKHVLEQA